MSIDITQAYGLALIGFFFFLALSPYFQVALTYTFPLILKIWRLPPIIASKNKALLWFNRHLAYPALINRGLLLNSWSRSDVFLFIVLIAANLISVLLKGTEDLSVIGQRAGTLAIINMVIMYATPSLSFLADILHVRIQIQQRIHACVGVVILGLLILHTITSVIQQAGFRLEQPENQHGLLGMSAVCFMAFPFRLFKRFLPYELLLISHRSLSICLIYFVWRHVEHHELLPRIYVQVIVLVFSSAFLIQFILTLYKNRLSFSVARLSHQSGIIRITLHLRSPVKFEPGQYINLWMFASPVTVIQSHPFTVVSGAGEPQKQLELIIEPRQGFTRHLLNLAGFGDTSSIAAFTGPHGRIIPAQNYDFVLLIAKDFGIAAVLPFIERLVNDYCTYKSCMKRVHLAWQIENLDLGAAAEGFLNKALHMDGQKQDLRCKICNSKHEGIFRISIFHQLKTAKFASGAPPTMDRRKELHIPEVGKVYHVKLNGPLKEEGQILGNRARLCSSNIKIRQLLDDESQLKPMEDSMIIIASVPEQLREELYTVMIGRPTEICLFYTDYQP